MTRTIVRVYARDPISETGVKSQLRHRPEVRIVGPDDNDAPEVVVVVVDSVDTGTLDAIRFLRRNGDAAVVLVVSHLDGDDLARAIESGAIGLLRRTEATAERLTSVIAAASIGEGTVPPDLLGPLIEQAGRLHRGDLPDAQAVTFTGLSAREVKVLSLVADGWTTAQIAAGLGYSERTVKNVLHDLTTRLQLRNRSHAVAFALREGLI